MTELVEVPEPLPLVVSTGSMVRTQIARDNTYAVYKTESGHFEVMKIRTKKAYTKVWPNGVSGSYPFREVMPGSEDFGRYAWSWSTKDQVNKQLMELGSELRIA